MPGAITILRDSSTTLIRSTPGRRALATSLAGLWLLGLSGAAAAQPDIGGDWGDAEDFLDDGDEDEDYEQPPVTAGGLYTLETYPTAEIDRPLTLTEGVAELSAGLELDLSSENALEVFYGRLGARYGLLDHVELQAELGGLLIGDVTPTVLAAGGRHEFDLALGIESAIVYDLVNFRATAEIPIAPDAGFDIALGTPLFYSFTSELAILAADRLLTIHTDGRRPDLTAGVGALYQFVPEAAAIARAEITLPEADTDLDPVVPIIATLQVSPDHRADIGLEVGLANVAADDSFAQRFALLFGQFRL